MYLNKALLVGNLTRDPETKALPSGTSVTTFSVATNRVWKDASGNRKEETDYHNIVVFGRQAETVAQYLHKGDSVMVEGRMQTRSWDDKDGNKKYRTEVIADRVQFGPKRGASEDRQIPVNAPKKGKSKESEIDTIEYPDEEINPDDIPF